MAISIAVNVQTVELTSSLVAHLAGTIFPTLDEIASEDVTVWRRNLCRAMSDSKLPFSTIDHSLLVTVNAIAMVLVGFEAA